MKLSRRIIHGSFWGDPGLCRWCRDKRMLYLGLWSVVEDGGIEDWDCFGIKMLLFPSPLDSDITVDVIKQWMIEMWTEKKILFYEVDDRTYFFLINFQKYQKLTNPSSPKIIMPEWCKFFPYPKNPAQGTYKIDNDMIAEKILQEKKQRENKTYSKAIQSEGLLTIPLAEKKPVLEPPIAVKYDSSSEEMKLSTAFYNMIKTVVKLKMPDEKKLQEWAEVFNKLIRIDEHSAEEIGIVINWIPDSWWGKEGAGAISSPTKFRMKKKGEEITYFARMLMQMKGSKNGGLSNQKIDKFEKSGYEVNGVWVNMDEIVQPEGVK